MQRRARTYVTSAALAVALTGGLTACTGSSGDDQADTKPGSTTASPSPAPPGKYRTLPEPCGAVDEETLKAMLPGAAEAGGGSDDSDDVATGSASPYEGEADVTYDTDRRVGCTWESATSLGSRHLNIDFERVVSYDPAVSDEEEAVLLYDERAGEADIAPSSAPSDPQSEQDEADQGNEGDDGTEGGSQKTGTGAGQQETAAEGETGDPGTGENRENGGDGESGGIAEPASPTPGEELAPRTLGSLGDAAFIDDELATTESGRATHRDITLVFRTSNVLVTVEYTQSVADERRTPDSAELQESTRNLAQQLAEAFNDA